MKFQTCDENDIVWMRDPSGYDAEDTIRAIKDSGKWDQLLQQEADEEGVVDTEALYDFIRHSSSEALLSVGLHYNEAEVTPLDVVKEWEEDNKDSGLKVSWLDDKTPSGFQLYNYGGKYGICIEFESIDEHGEVEEVSLDPKEVLSLMGHVANNNATEGAWTGTDVESDKFEMWRGEE